MSQYPLTDVIHETLQAQKNRNTSQMTEKMTKYVDFKTEKTVSVLAGAQVCQNGRLDGEKRGKS